MRRLSCCLFLCAFALAQEAPADWVLLKSGRRLEGHLTSSTWSEVSFEDKELGALVVKRDRVRAIVTEGVPADIFHPTPPEDPEARPSQFTRYVRPEKDRAGSLDTGVSRWLDPSTGTVLFLVGAVHIGEAQYYHRLQAILDSCDVVLFEGVRPGKDGRMPSPEELARLDTLRALQVSLKDMLQLVYQPDGLDYLRSFWKNADTDFGSLSDELKRRNTELPTDNKFLMLLTKLIFGLLDREKVKSDPVLQKRLRRQFAAVMPSTDRLLKRMGPVAEVLIDFRNEVAWKRLEAELAQSPLKGRWISLFYGAAHLADFARRLEEAKWTYQGHAWIPAWVIDP